MPSFWVRGIASFAEGGVMSLSFVYAILNRYVTSSSVSQLPGKQCIRNSRWHVDTIQRKVYFLPLQCIHQKTSQKNVSTVPALLILPDY